MPWDRRPRSLFRDRNGEGDAEDSVKKVPGSAIYEKPDSQSVIYPKPQPAKLARDLLHDEMYSGRYIHVVELEKKLPDKWVSAMGELIELGWAFDRDGNSFRMRMRGAAEHKQRLVELIRNLRFTLDDEEEGPVDVSGRSDDTLPDLPDGEEVRGESGPFDDNEGVSPVEEIIDPSVAMIVDKSEDKKRVVLSAMDFVTETNGILARKGAGKTYLGMVLAEELRRCTMMIPFVILDPMGVWFGLGGNKAAGPGDRSILILGGKYGEVVIKPDQGKKVAQAVVAIRPEPVLLDLSSFDREEQYDFGADFLLGLFNENCEPLHIFMDEADTFAPQQPDPTSRPQRRSLRETDNLVRRGRTRGLGITLITQRAAVINKNVLSQVDSLFLLQTRSPHDLAAIGTWLENSGINLQEQRECIKNLPLLGKGWVYYTKGGDSHRFCKFQVREKQSFDSSFTPRMGQKIVSPTLAHSRVELLDKVAEILAKS